MIDTDMIKTRRLHQQTAGLSFPDITAPDGCPTLRRLAWPGPGSALTSSFQRFLLDLPNVSHTACTLIEPEYDSVDAQETGCVKVPLPKWIE
ncbi:hypothetical protein [Novosphingobium sp. PP1Y]|uniref:hypothetical protein n=1 Tax=Novosphingobium sp. PP1Y TaxID=702113 RepID=UPI0005A1F1A5|nr:hypothetical protein [Novosphingobium sp. PP1Y]